MKSFFKLMALAGSLALCGCSGDEVNELSPSSDVNINPAADVSSGVECTAQFTPNYCYIWDINHLNGSIIELEDNTPVKAYDTRHIFNFSQQAQADGTSALVANLQPGVKLSEVLTDEVVITSQADEKQQQVIALILRYEYDDAQYTRASTPIDRFSEYFSYAYHLWGDVGNTSAHPVLKAKMLSADQLVNYTVTPSSQYYQTTGSSIQQTTEKHSYNFGLSGSGMVKGFLLGGSLSGSVTKEQKERDEYEYIMATKEYIAASATLNTLKMADKYKDVKVLLDSTANNVLNNTNSTAYKMFGNDTTGIYNLLDYYGSHLVTGGTFGADFVFLYSRKRAVTEHSVEWQLAATVNLARKGGTTAQSDTIKAGEAAAIKALAKAGITPEIKGAKTTTPADAKATFGTTQAFSDYCESTESHTYFKTLGGNSNEISGSKYEDFKATDDPDKWWLINYNFTINGNKNVAQFIPIYELCTNPTRKAALKKALTPVHDAALGIDICPYFKSRHCAVRQAAKKSPIVIADFQPLYQTFDGKNTHYHAPGQPRPKVMIGPDNKKRTYYPMMTNPLIYQGQDAGYAFSPWYNEYTSGASRVDCNMLYYYALDYADQCHGFTDIGCYYPDEAPRGWVKRGHRTDLNTTFSKEKYIYAQLAGYDTDPGAKIKGIGVYAEKQKAGLASIITGRNFGDLPIASTGGTEYARPFGIKEGDYFRKYWVPVPYNKSTHKPRVLFMSRGYQSQYMWLGTTKKDIEKRCTYEYDPVTGEMLEPQICHPLPW